jgi:hypothetical protein
MALANILMIGLLLRVFYEDIKDRKVTFIVLVILLLLGDLFIANIKIYGYSF